MSAKKRFTLLTAAVISIALVCFVLGALGLLDRGIPADEFSADIEAVQFGDIPSSGAHTGDKKHPEITLSRESSALYGATPKESQIYDTLHSGLLLAKEEISFSGMGATVEEINSAFTHVLNTGPELFYVSSSYDYGTYDGVTVEYVRPTYKLSGQALADARARYEELVSNIISQVEPSWSELEKVLFVHDYIVKNFEYDYTYSIYNTYDFLKNKKGVCQAYTLLCIELLGRLDIGVGSVPSRSMEHIWNSVEIDGKWYHMDITWDDASAPGPLDRFDEVSYESFLCSDSQIAEAGTDGHHDWVSELTFSDDYDELFIKTVGSKIDISPLGDDWYILVRGGKNENAGISLALADFEGNTYTQITHIKAKWYVWGSASSYYQDIFAGLGRYFDSLVISTSNELYAYNPSTGLVKLGDYLYDVGYICGMRINSEKATLRITKDPSSYADSKYYEVDLSLITFDLNISCKNKAGNEIGTHTVSLGWGNPFSLSAPSFEGHEAESSQLDGKMPLGGMSKTVVYKEFASLKIDYVYRNGETAHESYIDQKAEVGALYSVASPSIDGYFPNIQRVEGIMTSGGVTLTVVYSQDFYDIKITYLYEDGSPACETYIASGLAYMSEYSVVSPEIIGFTPSSATVSGNITENIEVTVTYTVTQCKISVKYLYPDGSLIEEKNETLAWGSDFEFVSPSITGYTAEIAVTSGKIEQNIAELTVRYTANKYLLQIEYIYSDGSPASEAYVEEIDYGAQYSVISPSFDNYTAALEAVSGTMTDSGVSVTVIYTLTKYKVSFVNGGEVFFETELEYGSVITLPEALPQKSSTAQKVYTFNSWDGYSENMTVEEDIAFTAVFDESARKYKVTFKNYDGAVLYETEVEYGEKAEYIGETPERLPADGVIYTFVEWDEDTANIIADTVFTAIFSDGVTKYTVSFYDWDGTLLKEEKVYHGHSAALPSDPTRASDMTYRYIFNGWSGRYKRVTSDSEVRATYKAEYIEYTVVFKNYDGTILSEYRLHYGDKVSTPETPTRESDERYQYIFSGWSRAVDGEVVGNAEYQALFSQHRIYKFSTRDFMDAFDKIASAKTLEERFEAINRVVSMKEDTDLSDPALAETLEALEGVTEQYNSDVTAMNKRFAKANGRLASFFGNGTVYINALLLIWELVKRLLRIT